jgi:rubrerythrin
MKLIKTLTNQIEEELEGAEGYISMAIAQRDHNPSLSKVLYEISLEEMHHVDLLHAEVVKLIEDYRRAKGEPPEAMMSVYEYLHEKHIKLAARIKVMQSEYKK